MKSLITKKLQECLWWVPASGAMSGFVLACQCGTSVSEGQLEKLDLKLDTRPDLQMPQSLLLQKSDRQIILDFSDGRLIQE